MCRSFSIQNPCRIESHTVKNQDCAWWQMTDKIVLSKNNPFTWLIHPCEFFSQWEGYTGQQKKHVGYDNAIVKANASTFQFFRVFTLLMASRHQVLRVGVIPWRIQQEGSQQTTNCDPCCVYHHKISTDPVRERWNGDVIKSSDKLVTFYLKTTGMILRDLLLCTVRLVRPLFDPSTLQGLRLNTMYWYCLSADCYLT